MDHISSIMLQNLPINALHLLLSILNNIINSNRIPEFRTKFKVIPIPKANTISSFRPIALSSAICKVFEYIIKNKLDWWLESNSILPENIYAFRRGRSTTQCLAKFTSKIYQSFNNREFFIATFIDTRGAFDSVNIPLLLSHFKTLNLPSFFPNLILLLSQIENYFSSRQSTPPIYALHQPVSLKVTALVQSFLISICHSL